MAVTLGKETQKEDGISTGKRAICCREGREQRGTVSAREETRDQSCSPATGKGLNTPPNLP